MVRLDPSIDTNLDALLAQADIAALRSNLALSPAQRMANLVAMNMFHARVQSRTLAEPVRAALRQRDIEDARARLEEAERERPAE